MKRKLHVLWQYITSINNSKSCKLELTCDSFGVITLLVIWTGHFPLPVDCSCPCVLIFAIQMQLLLVLVSHNVPVSYQSFVLVQLRGLDRCWWKVSLILVGSQRTCLFFRDLDRERAKLKQQEKKVIADIKKMAKLGQMVSYSSSRRRLIILLCDSDF